MRRYKVEYFQGDRSKPIYLTQISKSGKHDGVQVWFYGYDVKIWQLRLKNNMITGIDKEWFKASAMNKEVSNWKKSKLQGITIIFKK